MLSYFIKCRLVTFICLYVSVGNVKPYQYFKYVISNTVQISILSSEFVPVHFLNIYTSFNPEIAAIYQGMYTNCIILTQEIQNLREKNQRNPSKQDNEKNSKPCVTQIKEMIFGVQIQLRHVNCQSTFFVLLTHRCPADQSTCLG